MNSTPSYCSVRSLWLTIVDRQEIAGTESLSYNGDQIRFYIYKYLEQVPLF